MTWNCEKKFHEKLNCDFRAHIEFDEVEKKYLAIAY